MVALKTVLPNGLEIEHVSQAETEHFYEDHFVRKVAFENGVSLSDGDVIFDVGANIGLFSLSVHATFQNLRILAFEPAPPLVEVLRRNLSNHGVDSSIIPVGVSDRSGSATFTYYPFTSGMSTFMPEPTEAHDHLRKVIETAIQKDSELEKKIGPYLEEIVEFRLHGAKNYECPLVSLSQMIFEHGIDHIDLLKIDVENAELDVLKGISTDDWCKIQQLFIEVHDVDGRLGVIYQLLEEQGFRVTVDQDPARVGTSVHSVYATR